MASTHKPVLGLIGGIGCGKSSVARWLAEHLRGYVVNADAIGHAVLLREDVRSQLTAAFGPEILKDGEVNRSAVAQRVFGDSPTHIAARKTLEGIVYPIMHGEIDEEFAAAQASADVDLIVYDAAVMLESGLNRQVDVIVYLDVPFEERLRRVTASRGWTEEELRRREASQWPLEKKRSAADVIINNAGTVDSAGRQIEAYLRKNNHLPPQLINKSTSQLVN